jgi:hypothetical protein
LISISAILNKHGAGELWFGAAPDGKAAGLVVNEKTLRDILRIRLRIKNHHWQQERF